MNTLDFNGRSAVVTGGGAGIGLAVARRLASSGAKVSLWDSDERALGIAREAFGFADSQRVDVADAESVARAADATASSLGGIDVLVCSAGVAGANHMVWEYPLDEWRRVIDINLNGVFYCNRAVVPIMQRRNYGRIVNIASIAGLGGNPPEMQTLAYNTSKGAVINFTRALGCEWGKYNITVNAICPGFFPSRMTQATLSRLGEDKLAAHAPLQRLGDDEDLKGVTLLFASDAGKHITGQWLAVDGGVSVVTGG